MPPQTARLVPVSGGGLRRLNQHIDRPFRMTKERPAHITKEPAYQGSVYYAVLPMDVGPQGAAMAVTESADFLNGRLYLDANGNGDLTDDPEVRYLRVNYSDGGLSHAFEGRLDLTLRNHPVGITFFRYNSEFAKRSGMKDNLMFIHRDEAQEGKATFGGREYEILIKDMAIAGRYDGSQKSPSREVALFVDRNGNHKFEGEFERYDLAKPFTLDGRTYELKKVSPDGSRIEFRDSKVKVAEVPMPGEVLVGQLAPGFVGTDFDGKALRFPQDFRGKLVLLDFWNAGCGACFSEAPNLERVRNRYRTRGVEVLGVNLDPGGQASGLKALARKSHMPWRHVYDGEGWKSPIVRTYGVKSIPDVFLVDGTTGRILATDDDGLRGEKLTSTLERILTIRDSVSSKPR